MPEKELSGAFSGPDRCVPEEKEIEMAKNRRIKKIIKGKPVLEGAGVHLNRAFGFGRGRSSIRFCCSTTSARTTPGITSRVPWHPHRGIETITYILDGKVEHGDSMGNKGVIGPGDVQWMTAGSGIIHQEMPKGD